MPRSWADLFWVALAIVAGCVIVFAARAAFRDQRTRRARWLPIVAGLALVLPAACAQRPLPPPASSSEPAWDNARWAADLQRA